MGFLEKYGRGLLLAEALRIHRVCLVRRAADRCRRKTLPLLGDGVEQAVQPQAEPREPLRLTHAQRKALGRRGVRLLTEIWDGVRGNDVLAELLGTQAASIRVRRERLVEILAQWLAEILGENVPPRND